MAKKKDDKWIQDAKIKKGALREELNVPEGKPIPASKLEIKPGDSAKTKRRKNLARVFKKIKKK